MTDLRPSDDELITAGSTTALAAVSSTKPGRRRKCKTHICGTDMIVRPILLARMAWWDCQTGGSGTPGRQPKTCWLSRGDHCETIPRTIAQ